jgi:hypothetical protein
LGEGEGDVVGLELVVDGVEVAEGAEEGLGFGGFDDAGEVGAGEVVGLGDGVEVGVGGGDGVEEGVEKGGRRKDEA